MRKIYAYLSCGALCVYSYFCPILTSKLATISKQCTHHPITAKYYMNYHIQE